MLVRQKAPRKCLDKLSGQNRQAGVDDTHDSNTFAIQASWRRPLQLAPIHNHHTPFTSSHGTNLQGTMQGGRTLDGYLVDPCCTLDLVFIHPSFCGWGLD